MRNPLGGDSGPYEGVRHPGLRRDVWHHRQGGESFRLFQAHNGGMCIATCCNWLLKRWVIGGYKWPITYPSIGLFRRWLWVAGTCWLGPVGIPRPKDVAARASATVEVDVVVRTVLLLPSDRRSHRRIAMK